MCVASPIKNGKIAEEMASKNIKAIDKTVKRCARRLAINCNASGTIKTKNNSKLLFDNCSVALTNECSEQVVGADDSKSMKRANDDQ